MTETTKRPEKRVTVIDVARAAQVSPGTVSNAINGKRPVDSETRARIEKAIATLGYVPNMAARGMRTGRAGTIALFSSMPTAVAAGASKLGFMMEIAASAAQVALRRNVALVLVPPIAAPADALRNVPFDGALLVEPAEDDPFLDLLSARAVPVVGIGAAPRAGMPCIDLHYRATAKLLTEHLLSAGSRSFPLVIGTSARQYYREFEEMYCTILASAGLVPRVIRVDEAHGEEAGAAAVEARLAEDPALDGVLVPVDALATGVMAGLRAAGRNVPRDVRVVTRYDGLRARTETPPLTAVDLHLEEAAERGTLALLDMIEGAETPPVRLLPEPALVLRASSAPE
ncbi:substrate-binding domain-containing protein [Roseivivax sediminis]|uniref:DNA-binding transcriptional regulator, LacI/PurR family n=1 Tax=Roseivivax sediminis TaxID=936889 RepID=A0A1I2CSX0_9RHOB|nr:substrate-binding domain-containing protein [Roseivivax sediminis]SFE71411.1 DNA-binding transcriptional regulator, LacI/PurR family [Roseivivax sediminis]